MIRKSAEIARSHALSAFRYLSLEVSGLHAAAYVLAVAALLSSLLALLRDRLLAHVFGASVSLDLYYAAFRIPDLIFVATGALVSVYMLIPELARRTTDEQKDYIDTIVVGFSLFAAVVAFVAAILAPFVLARLFPQFFLTGHGSMLIMLARIMLLQPILLGISNVFAGVTQARKRYALYAMSPLLYNLGIIIGIWFFYPLIGLLGLAWGVVFGAFLHMSIQLPSLFADGFFWRIPKLRDPRALIYTAMVSVPRALALSMTQLAFIGLTALAGLLASGSIAVFMFAYNLAAVPLSIIGASYSVAAFPTLAQALSRGETDTFVAHVAAATRYIFFWSMPASALILVLRAHIVRVILGSGAFNWNDTRLTAAAFALISLSLAAQGIMLLLVRGYYAAGKTFVPLLVSSVIAGSTVLFGALGLFVLQDKALLHLMEHALRVDDLPGSKVLVLALAYALAAIIGTIVLLMHFEHRFGGLLRRIRRACGESCLAALTGGLAAYIVLSLATPLSFSFTALSVFTQGFIAGIAGIAVSTLTYYLLGSREYAEVYTSLRARIWRMSVPETEVTITASAEDAAGPSST